MHVDILSNCAGYLTGTVAVCEDRAFINDTSCPRVRLNASSFHWQPNGSLHYDGGVYGVPSYLDR